MSIDKDRFEKEAAKIFNKEVKPQIEKARNKSENNRMLIVDMMQEMFMSQPIMSYRDIDSVLEMYREVEVEREKKYQEMMSIMNKLYDSGLFISHFPNTRKEIEQLLNN